MPGSRDIAARALLELIGRGHGTTFPHPDADYRNALAVVDALAEHCASAGVDDTTTNV